MATSPKLLTTIFVPTLPLPTGNFVVTQVFAITHWDDKMQHPKQRDEWIIAVLDRNVKSIRRIPASLPSQKFLTAFDAARQAAQALGQGQIPANFHTPPLN